MPFKNEKANKFSHEKIINNKLLKEKLSNFKITYDVSNNSDTLQDIKSKFNKNERESNKTIDFIFTVDSSFTEIPLDENIPSAKIGIVNFSSNIIDLSKKSEIYSNGFINPQKFNDIYNSQILTFICPTFNLVTINDEGMDTLQSIRKEIYDFFCNSKPFNSISLLQTLYNLIVEIDGSIKLKCTNSKCESNVNSENKERLIFNLKEIGIEPFVCPLCGKTMYLSDHLRLHEAVDLEFGHSNLLSRFSQITEHLIALNVIDTLMKYKSFALLSKIAFIIDGPLAIYGEPAKIHKNILKYLHNVSKRVGEQLIYFGISKTGKLKDHFSLIERKLNIEPNSFLLVDDSYRFKYIQKAPENNKFFGQEVLFGQDFLFYSIDKKKFVITMLYPIDNKSNDFGEIVFDKNQYGTLPVIFKLVNNISIDIYEDAILPVALSHKYAAISLNPGNKIIEIFAKQNIQ
ncbi:DNA double-strand break repair nuclease NurA [Clostridium malenominatum]|uniref:DNA double-strand break repair nuclease NurA n=1 Tax=Clostridium malenominatum TaxID=1539 RepID=A0ABP3TR91_9CLOT